RASPPSRPDHGGVTAGFRHSPVGHRLRHPAASGQLLSGSARRRPGCDDSRIQEGGDCENCP
ncbi:hypothetical protein, partial [Mitsuokella jalaludinii]|uniref:hypothetical protein n=1 Tax=Mitsuokella jalaludinii TaxID=187979 RepID=UPI003F9A806A